MWHQQKSEAEEGGGEALGRINGMLQQHHHFQTLQEHSLQHHIRRSAAGYQRQSSVNNLSGSASQVSLNASSLGVPGSTRSMSGGTLSHSSSNKFRRATVGGSNGNNIMMNETFRIPHFADNYNNPFAHLTSVSAQLHPILQRQPSPPMQLAVPPYQQPHPQPQRPHQSSGPPSSMMLNGGGASSAPSSATSMLHRGLSANGVAARRRHPSAVSVAAVPISEEGSLSVASSCSSSDDTEKMVTRARKRECAKAEAVPIAPPPSLPVAPKPQIGPSVLYLLIAGAGKSGRGSAIDWDAVLERAQNHPQEACFFDPDAGGHVYALHRLLRRMGEDCSDDGESCSSSSGMGGCRRRPPVAVVEAVMLACPRAVTRKQAVIDEDGILGSMDEGGLSGGIVGGGNMADNENRNPWQVQHQQQQQGLLLNFPPPPRENNGAVLQDQQLPPDDDNNEDNDNGDDVRFEYPLAIACEHEHDGEVVRLLASFLSTTDSVYRSEVFRSLDYASLPNSVVRILLEEHAGCVLERGMNSEATEGDDDDCPLEQILFWWDDPDMMGMEEDIANYPNCNMCEDLRDLWEKLRMMLYAANMGTMVGYDKAKESFKVLHHILRIVSEGGIQDVRFPNDFVHAVLLLAKFIQREKGLMFEERDESGSLPLHIAVSGNRLLQPTNRATQSRTESGRTNERDEGTEQGGDNGDHNANADGGDAMEDAGPVHDEAQPQQNDMPFVPPEGQQGALPPVVVAVPQAEAGRGGGENQAPQADEEDEEDEDGGDHDPGEDINVASSMPSDMEIVRLLLTQHPASIRLRDSLTGSLPVHLALRNNPHSTEAINYLIDLYPRSLAMPDGEGRLPLHTALIRESPMWERVLGLSPAALEARDPLTGLLPFQLAAMSKPQEKSKDAMRDEAAKAEGIGRGQGLDTLSTTFSLLRRNPCLVYGLGASEPGPQSLIEQPISCMGLVRHTPRVARLEEENERLRQRVEELECKLLSMQMTHSSVSSPMLKKRKSSSYGMR